jgi:hypothetical protein
MLMHSAHLAICALANLLDLGVPPLDAGAPAEPLVLVAQDGHLDLPVNWHHDCGRLEHRLKGVMGRAYEQSLLLLLPQALPAALLYRFILLCCKPVTSQLLSRTSL